MVIGSIAAIIAGLLLPSISVVMGEVSETFGPEHDKKSTLNNM